MGKFSASIIVTFVLLVPIAVAQNAKLVARKVFPSVVSVFTFDNKGEIDGFGSGFFVRSDAVITNYHVIEGSTSAKGSVVGSKTVFDIEGVLGVDVENDLALLKVKGIRGTPLRLADITTVETGTDIFALGNPRGMEGTISPGIVSGLNFRTIGGTKYIQITAPISPGSSGGPVVNVAGAVVGVVAMSRKDSQNLNFAIPSTMVSMLLAESRNASVEPLASFAKKSIGLVPGTLRKTAAGIELVWIPPGEFMMGSTDAEVEEFHKCKKYDKNCMEGLFDETPKRKVAIREGFWLGKYEVTQGEWQSVMGDNPSYFKDLCARCPVEQVSWGDIQVFFKRINAKDTQFEYSLPTEAQWEYAARAGTTTAFAFGDSLNSTQANFDGNYPYASTKGAYVGRTVAVGSYRPNAWGLYDMHGNVSEWVQDVYASSYSGLPTDGSANLTVGEVSYRVSRGGSWIGFALDARSANRGRNEISTRKSGDIGFRVVARPR